MPRPRPNPTPELLSTSEAAALINVSAATLKRWAQAGLVASERTRGGHRRFRRPDLDAFTGPGKGSDLFARRADALVASRNVLAVQCELHRERAERGSWWEVCEGLRGVVLELHRRLDRGAMTSVQWETALDRLREAFLRFGDAALPAPGAPELLLLAVPGDHVLVVPAALERCAAESGWAPRWGGHPTPRQLGAELRARPSTAIVVSGSAGVDAGAIERYAPELATAARAARAPLGVMGLGAWPADLPGATRLGGFVEAREWLRGVREAAGRAALQAGTRPAARGGGWGPSLAIGVPAVDLQHQRLFEEVERFAEAVRAGEAAARLRELLAFLADYAQVHFRTEEHVMRESGYPGLAEHAAEHAAFCRQVAGVTAEYDASGSSLGVLAAAAELVRAWLIQHVGSSDQRIAEHLRASGRGGRGA